MELADPKVPFGIVPSLVGRAQTSSGQSIIVKNGEYVVDDVEKVRYLISSAI